MGRNRVGVFANHSKELYKFRKGMSIDFYIDVYRQLEHFRDMDVTIPSWKWILKALYAPYPPNPVNREGRMKKDMNVLERVIECCPNSVCKRTTYCLDCLGSWRYKNAVVIKNMHEKYPDLRLLLRRETLLVPRGVYGIEGSEATHEDLFATKPIFTLGGGGDSIVYTNIRLNPGRAGIVLYRFILYYCNGAERDVYIVAFKCVESNYAPVYEPIISTIQVKEEEEYDKIVGKITDLDNDEVTVSEQEVEGGDILSDLELTVDDNNNVHLKFTAIKAGTAKISFIPDDGHNKIATYGFYERHNIHIYVGDTNLAPVVTITEPVIPLAVYNGGLKEMAIGTVTDADATVEGDANYIIEMIRYGIPQDLIKGEVFIRNGKLMVKVNDLGKDSLYTGHGEEDIVFRVHDVRQKYKDGMPEPVSFKFTLDTSIEYDPITTEVTMAPKQKLGKISFGKVTANYGSEYPAFRQYKLIILSENLPDSAVHGTASMDADGNVFAKNVVAGEEEGEYTFRGKVVDRYGNETNVFTIHFTVTNE